MTATNDLSRTALLLVDPYNDFLSDGGKLSPLLQTVADEVGLLDNLRSAVTAARNAGVHVLFVPHRRWEATNYIGWDHPNPNQQGVNRQQIFARGSWGGEFHPDLQPRPDECVVTEHWAQSGFANTDLDAQLTQRGITHVVLVGVVANTCIESTGRFAMELGYHVTLVRDATAAFSAEAMHAAHEINGRRTPTRSSPQPSSSASSTTDHQTPQEGIVASTVLADSTSTAVIDAPIDAIDLADWLFNLEDAEYQRCAPGEHIAAGATTTDDGRPMSINVEQVGTALAIQHYIGEIVTPSHCKLVSVSDSFTPLGRTTLNVTWELTLSTAGEQSLLTNRVLILPTTEYLEFLQHHGIPADQAAAESQASITRHNTVETPLFAKSIERKTLATTRRDRQ